MSEVLACVDLSDATEIVVEHAAKIAKGLGDRLHILHVAAEEPVIAGYDKDSMGVFTRDDRAHQLLDEHQGLRELSERLRSEGLEVMPLIEMGATLDQILEVADRIDAEVIAVGSHGHGGMHDLLVGSVSKALLKHSARPVLVVPVRAST